MPADSAAQSPYPPGVKLACATCIQGHRASSCKHQDGSKGPLLVVKRRGRPLSQCKECREKRLRTGRHDRCDCATRSKYQLRASATNEPPSKRRVISSLPETSSAFSTADETSLKSYAPMSFAQILNPCKCQANCICICCKTSFDNMHQAASPQVSTTSPSEALAHERDVNIFKDIKTAQRDPQIFCCYPVAAAEGQTKTIDDSLTLLVRAADMSRSYEPEYQCGSVCKCDGSLVYQRKGKETQ